VTLYSDQFVKSHTGSHHTRHPVDSLRWASTAPNHVEAFSKLPAAAAAAAAAADGYQLAIHGTLESVGTVLAADPVSVRVSRFKGARSLGHVPSLRHSSTVAEAAGGLGSDQSTSAIPKSPQPISVELSSYLPLIAK
jgi:hypothetical protein